MYRKSRGAFSRVARKYGPKLLNYAARKTGQAFRKRISGRTSSKSSPQETAPLTYDNDFKTDYRYKRMPRGKRRRWKRFVSKVNYVVNRGQGLKKLLYTDIVRLQSISSRSTSFSSMLYTPDARVPDLHADLGTMFRDILGATTYDNINTANINNDADKKVRFESASLDLTWRNVGSHAAIIDLYYVRARKTFGLTGVDGDNNCHGIYKLGFTKQGLIIDEEDQTNIGTAKQEADFMGTTPFQSSLFCQTYKILRKKRITIAPGNTVSMTLKDPRNKVINATDTRARICMRGLTHGYFFQTYGVPGLEGTFSTPTPALPTDVVFTQQKRYAFYLPVTGKDQTSIINL